MEVGLDSGTQLSTMKFYVDGVRCAKCIHKLENLNSEHVEISEARFNKASNILTLNPKEIIAPDQAIEWIESKGYKAYFVETSEQTESRNREAQRRWLTRLAVTFFFASNLMMFAIAIYMGAYGEWHRLFAWICGFLFLPIAFYSAIPFYASAWQALKDRRFSADLAIVIAFGWGSILSYFNLFRGNSNFYFDSTASFLFLILLARFFLDRAQNSIESDLNPSLLFKSLPVFEIKRGGETIQALYHQIEKGDLITLRRGQTLPVDIELQSEGADVDTSLFSGESFPQTFAKGSVIKAGMVGISESLYGKTNGTFQESELHRIFEGVIRNRHEKTKAHAKAEVYSQRLLTTVSFLSVVVLVFFGGQGHWAEGFRRALALFTIACPCALALAIPLASVMTLKRAMQQGLFVKSPLFFEKLLTITGVVFDKTGTLTLGQLEFRGWAPKPPDKETLQLLLAMEQKSHHPIAQSLTRLLLEQKIEPTTLDFCKDIPGVGVEAVKNGTRYFISRISTDDQSNLNGFELTSEGSTIVTAYFSDSLRPEAPTLIEKLKKAKLEVYLLSGDRQQVVSQMAKTLNLNENNALAQMSPQAKAQFIEDAQQNRLKSYLMVGDGHNDALALSKAKTSIAMKGSAETSLRAADAYSQKNDLSILNTAFELSHFYHRLIQQNVWLSLSYNVIAGTMAILGLVDPLMAAVLMPINSLVVIGATALARPAKRKER